ncbi:hypothetical protein RvY_11169 [Ramazzottius varieornatus]|uniref:HTH CENPB-type domain-containing protein n=1 Tax=Ramazzottius varieornatus TaxID=947166 RepID=A0A1D1VHA9_RAMVA|nr:hypothetical protein RvY_11169 [Ramazzottius varieornatus]
MMDPTNALNGLPEGDESAQQQKVAEIGLVTDDESEESQDESEASTEGAEPTDSEEATSAPTMSTASPESTRASSDAQPAAAPDAAPAEDGRETKKTRKKTKHNWYTIPEINRILASYRESNMSRRKFSSLMKIPESSLRRWEARKIPKGEPARRSAKFPAIEEEVYKWYKDQVAKRLPVSNIDIRQKAREIGLRDNVIHFEASLGWVTKLKKRRKMKTSDARFSSFKEKVTILPEAEEEAVRTVKPPKRAPKKQAKPVEAKKPRLILPKLGKDAPKKGMANEKVRMSIGTVTKPIAKKTTKSKTSEKAVGPPAQKYLFITIDH